MSRIPLSIVLFVCLSFRLFGGEVLDEIRTTGARNGIVVLVQGGDTTHDDASESGFTVLGLETDRERVDAMRGRIQRSGRYGKVSVSLFDGKTIPCVDSLVNVVVVEEGGLADEEVMRVLTPGGMALLRRDGQWHKRIKAWPAGMDEWNQYLRNADNNAVSTDHVGPPERLRWTGGTRWGRSHMSAVTVVSMVSAGGRVYTIEDLETVEYHSLPGRFFLIARDAFNGLELWKMPLPGVWAPVSYLKFIATQRQRRIAAIGDKLYCPLGVDEPISVLDGATGKVLSRHEGTAETQEFVYDRGVLYVIVGKPFATEGSADVDVRLLAVETATGNTLWQRQISDDSGYMGGTLAVKNNDLVYCTKAGIHCLAADTGVPRWQVGHSDLIPKEKKEIRVWLGGRLNNLQPTLVLSDDMLYCSTLYAINAYTLKDGNRVWTGDNVPNYGKPSDIFIAGGLVWSGLLNGHDPKTGEVVRKLNQQMQGPMTHDRCYRNRITETYFINSKTGGSDFVRLDGKGEFPAPWVRGTCGLGVFTANGLLYSSPYSCTCEIGIMLTSFNALYSENRPQGKVLDLSPAPRFIRGPAYAPLHNQSPIAENYPEAWPTYRNTNSRSGAISSTYNGGLATAWKARLPSAPTAPVVVGDKVFIAARDSHMLCALSRKTGEIVWTFTAEGRIDSPPTYHRGMLLFGSRGGWVYALRAADGELAWQFNDLPEKRLIGVHGQLESAWPVNGSVLVHDSVAYFAAGRQSFIDGGIVVYRLDPLTGTVQRRRRLHGPQDERGYHIYAKGQFRSQGFKSGIFSAEHGLLYMRHQAFRPDLTPVSTEDIRNAHLVVSGGFLDDMPQHRTYWSIDTDLRYGPANGADTPGPQGDVVAVDGDVVYEVRGYLPGRHGKLDPRKGYTLYSSEKIKAPTTPGRKPRTSIPFSGRWNKRWATQIPLSGHALIVTADTVVVAGVPFEKTSNDADLSSSFAGKKGGLIWTASKEDGTKIASLSLPAPPTWDGLASAGGECFLALKDGTVLCFSGATPPR